MELSDIFARPDVIQAIATVTAFGAAWAFLTVVTMWSVAKAAQYWRMARGLIPEIRAQVDDPTDAANVAIDRVLDRFYVAQWENMAAVFLPKFLDEVAKIVDAKLEAPAQEVNVATEATPQQERYSPQAQNILNTVQRQDEGKDAA